MEIREWLALMALVCAGCYILGLQHGADWAMGQPTPGIELSCDER